jgi:hypothetical protein
MALIDAENIARLVHLHGRLPCALLPGILCFENAAELLEGLSGSLDSEEVDQDHFDGNPGAVHNV